MAWHGDCSEPFWKYLSTLPGVTLFKGDLSNHLAIIPAGLHKFIWPIGVVHLAGGTVVSRCRGGQSGHFAEVEVFTPLRILCSPEAHALYPPVVHTLEKHTAGITRDSKWLAAAPYRRDRWLHCIYVIKDEALVWKLNLKCCQQMQSRAFQLSFLLLFVTFIDYQCKLFALSAGFSPCKRHDLNELKFVYELLGW